MADEDYEVANITIAAGMDDSDHGMPEVLVLYGVMGSMQTNSLTFNIWDEAVLAPPVIAQLLLAAVLGADRYRRYLRAGSLRRAPENGAAPGGVG